MSIYDVRFYGYRTMNKCGNATIVMNPDDSYTKKMPRKVTFDNSWQEKFSTIILEEYDGKKDVLKVEYATGREEYFTLHMPWCTKNEKENVWEDIQENQFAVKFADTYANFVLHKNAESTNSSKDSIFAREFWIVRCFESYTLRTIVKAFVTEIEAREYKLTLKQKNNIDMAIILPEYMGKEYVLKYKEQYFTLFGLLYSYDEGAGKWCVHDEPDREQILKVSNEIKEAYIKDISNND